MKHALMWNRWLSRLGIAALLLPSGVVAQAAADEILFSSNRDGNGFEMYRMRADGSGAQRIARESHEARDLSWSPDGSSVLFSARRANNIDIYVAKAASGELRRLTDDAEADTGPVWSPDGKKIVFVSMRDKTRKLYVMNADGSGQRRLTDSVDDEFAPALSPRRQQAGLSCVDASIGALVAGL